ncbi:hypothetical protein [Hydrogenimonas thermophila]|uniref:Uncharacterized protein n=1 Tax=Hydrogenimonas thermophila TaxID=223786 RepID=A0A1I5MY58_9BACT|nr:hypothetical protein [Hydrogenimonas thermophila]WOE68980.1 hypothetical protein RZR91_07635 [Hydrogenimonas thermophila]WOE71487.1 hypothetical protein RZR97_07600 [Hydrogenimonas thermophila]SFP14400.1 hypothetical protein SAMN05216234_10776 [Hydrogenimonas thermophila]
MIELSGDYKKRYDALVQKAKSNSEDEKLKSVIAFDTIVKEIEKNGFMEIIDLDPYFGDTLLPLKEHTDLLEKNFPEEFSFFKAFMEDLQEEIELYFEVTEMYEDEEFDQFVEDIKTIKSRYSEIFKKDYKEKMNSFAMHLVNTFNTKSSE